MTQKTDPKVKCVRCAYFIRTNDKGGGCFRYPPQATQDVAFVQDGHWCGEYMRAYVNDPDD